LLAARTGAQTPTTPQQSPEQPPAATPQPPPATTPAAKPPVAQRDIFDAVFGSRRKPGEPEPPPRKLELALFPVIGYDPANGLLFGVGGNVAARLGPPETTTLSSLGVSAVYTAEKQVLITLPSNVYTKGNQYNLQGDWRYLDTSEATYGLGPAQPKDQKDELEYHLIRFYQTTYRLIRRSLLAGVGYHLDVHNNIVDPNAEAGKPSPFLAYNNGLSVTSETSSGVSLNLLYDSRDNPINATKGRYALLSFRAYPTWLGSTQNWQSLLADFRAYPRPGGGRNILAVWAFAWLTFGKAPYLDLPAIGWDTYSRSGRGYVQSQIRGKNMLYTEGEYRMSLSPDGLWGAVVFLNLIATTDPNSGRFGLNSGVGFGLRVKLNKGSGTNIAIDYGFGQQDTQALYLNAQETF
jgi:hypothetical protein